MFSLFSQFLTFQVAEFSATLALCFT